MRLKDSKSLSLIPLNEVELQGSPARIEFLHYTQMPLTVGYMEQLISKDTGKRDNILTYILKNSKDNAITVDKLSNKLLGENASDFIAKYLRGSEILPLWNAYASNLDKEEDLVNRLNNYEFELYTWFSLENSLYKYDFADIKDLEKLYNEAVSEKVQFASDAEEALVKENSPTIYKLLKAHALRAKVCSVEYNDASLREKLLASQTNLDKWDTFKKNLK